MKAVVLAISLVSAFLIATPVHAAKIAFGVTGGLNMGFTRGGDAPEGFEADGKGAMGFGGGVLVGFTVNPKAQIEMGVLYQTRPASATTTASPSLMIPATFYFNVKKIFWIGVGGYYDNSMSSAAKSDYGLSGGVRLAFPKKVTFFVDAKFHYGFKDFWGYNDTEGLLLLGLKFGGKK